MDEDYLWSPAETIEELRLTYNRMRLETNIKKRDIIDRILDGDWRRGLSLYQVATIDLQCLSENEKALRWTALKLVSQRHDGESAQPPLHKKRKMDFAPYPTVSPNTFLRNLQHEISPLVKAHYYLHHLHAPYDLSIIRICVADSPYINPRSCVQSQVLFTDPYRIIFIALPDSCPYIYISVSGAAKESNLAKREPLPARMDITSLKRTVLEAIPKALSKSQHRYALESTSLTARSLSTMLALRGNSGTNAANGVYTIFANGVVDNSPIDAEKMTFAQKILQACEGEDDREHDLNGLKLSSESQEQNGKRTPLAERSTNTPCAENSEDWIDLKIAAAARFGMVDNSQAKPDSAEPESTARIGGLDRLQIRLDEDLVSLNGRSFPLTADEDGDDDVEPFDQVSPSKPKSMNLPRQGSACMNLTFQGGNIFLGIRKLVELGLIGIEKLPAWMTGEEAISGGKVRHGIVVHGKGSGA